MGSLRIDMFDQERYLPSGISMKLRFHRQKDSYMLMAPKKDDAHFGYSIKLKEAHRFYYGTKG